MKVSKILSMAAAAALLVSCSSDAVSVKSLPSGAEGEMTLTKLPAGSIHPQGWLLKQLQLQKNGMNGRLGELSQWLVKEGNAWLSPDGKNGWEELPYWLRGYSSLAYILEDKEMLEETQLWIDGILKSQTENGNFGPGISSAESTCGVDTGNNQDFWPNMIALRILQDYYEYSGDSRVIPFMSKYCDFLLSVPEDQFLESFWENSRGGDQLWSVAWLYEQTGDEKLVELGHKVHRNTANWTCNIPNWHVVNISQGLREPATYWLFSHDSTDMAASKVDFGLVYDVYGQMPGGLYAADEYARPGYCDPRQGAETCAMAEMMATDEIMLQINADPFWAENCENIAYNTLPAAFTPDYKALRYLTCANMAVSDSRDHAPGFSNSGNQLGYTPHGFRCCQHNHGFAWPYWTEHQVMTTRDAGAAVMFYSEWEASVPVADGKNVVLRSETHYPWDSTVRIIVDTDSKVGFPLYLRIPSWADNASVKVNGRKSAAEIVPGEYLRIARDWSGGDSVELNLPMEPRTQVWEKNKNSISVLYGPLYLSLQIQEDCRRLSDDEWPEWEIYPASDWNYALSTGCPVGVEKLAWPADDNPFTLEGAPLKFSAKGRIVPSWGFDGTGLTEVLPAEDAEKSDRLDDLTLVPMGSARLRISAFPQCD